jgi:integrase
MTAEVPQYEKNERTVWTAETAQKALSLCRERKLKLAMQLALGCSMRIGEILGLTWDCVDIRPERIEAQDAQLHVNKERKRCQKDAMEKRKVRKRSKGILEFPKRRADCSTVLVLKFPKTSSSVRNIFIPNTVAMELVREQKRQQAMKAMVYENYNLVLAQDDRRPVEENRMRKHLNAFIKANGLPTVVFHSLRHSSTSIKLELSQGNIKAVQGDTGHAQSNMVTDVYAHSNNTERKKLARLVEQQFFNRTGDSEQIPADDKTVKIIGLLKERPEMTDTFLTLLNAMIC